MLDVRYFRRRGVTSGSLAISAVFFGMFGMFFLLTQYLQLVRGHSALGAAVRTLPFALTIMVAAPSSAHLAARFGTRAVVGTGLTMAGTGLVLVGRSGLDTSYAQLAVSLVVLAAGMGLTMAPSTAAIMASLPHEKAGVGSALNDTTRELGGALGVAILGSLVTSRYSSSLAPYIASLPDEVRSIADGGLTGALGVAEQLGEAGGGTALAHQAQVAFVDGLGLAAMCGSAMVFIAAAAAWFLLPRDDEATTGATALDRADADATTADAHPIDAVLGDLEPSPLID